MLGEIVDMGEIFHVYYCYYIDHLFNIRGEKHKKYVYVFMELIIGSNVEPGGW